MFAATVVHFIGRMYTVYTLMQCDLLAKNRGCQGHRCTHAFFEKGKVQDVRVQSHVVTNAHRWLVQFIRGTSHVTA